MLIMFLYNKDTSNLLREYIYFQIMPQLLPFYFVNQLSFALFGLFVVIYVMSRFVLPAFTELFLTRMYITKL